jgi:hypothetical protein
MVSPYGRAPEPSKRQAVTPAPEVTSQRRLRIGPRFSFAYQSINGVSVPWTHDGRTTATLPPLNQISAGQ